MTLDDEVVRLGRTRPFDLLPREAVQLIAFSCEKRRLRAGEALFFPGEAADSGYFVHSGAITLLEDGAKPEAERRVGAGALIGESALYASTTRRVSARTRLLVDGLEATRIRSFDPPLAPRPRAAQ